MAHEYFYIVYDFETGGLDPKKNPITEGAFIVLEPENLEEVFRYENHVQQYDDLYYEPKALEYTGKTFEMIQKEGIPLKQFVNDISAMFKKYVNGRKIKYYPILVGHNSANFDRPFMRDIFSRMGLDIDDYVDGCEEDTMKRCISKFRYATDKPADFKLGSCCQYFGIELFEAHKAMPDVEATADLFRALMQLFREGNVSVSSGTTQKKAFRDTFQF